MALPDTTGEAAERDVLRTVAAVVWDSLSIKIALLGVVFVLIGYVLRTGELAALFPIWGGGLILIGVVSYVAIWRTRR